MSQYSQHINNRKQRKVDFSKQRHHKREEKFPCQGQIWNLRYYCTFTSWSASPTASTSTYSPWGSSVHISKSASNRHRVRYSRSCCLLTHWRKERWFCWFVHEILASNVMEVYIDSTHRINVNQAELSALLRVCSGNSSGLHVDGEVRRRSRYVPRWGDMPCSILWLRAKFRHQSNYGAYRQMYLGIEWQHCMHSGQLFDDWFYGSLIVSILNY